VRGRRDRSRRRVVVGRSRAGAPKPGSPVGRLPGSRDGPGSIRGSGARVVVVGSAGPRRLRLGGVRGAEHHEPTKTVVIDMAPA